MKRIIAIITALIPCLTMSADEGMWMINAINKALEINMQNRGLQLSANEIYDADAPGTALSDAIISLDFGCTGSIISDNGLIITNHHCAYSDVHGISTPEHNYLEDGFWAMSSSEERYIKGKGAYFLKKVIDVTDEVKTFIETECSRGGHIGMRKLSSIMEKRYSKAYGMEASLASMWRGEKYYIGLYQVFRDIRLVAAPPVCISAFGGDIDNWEWPQHKCDFALYRIYTAPDGSPAEYSEANIPLKPARKLEISLEGYKNGDYTMVIGYPGRTNRYCSSFAVDHDQRVSLPLSNESRGRQMEIISAAMNADPDVRLKYSDYYFSLSNFQELNCGQVECYLRFGVKEMKEQEEKQLQEWIDSDNGRKTKWGTLLNGLGKKYSAREMAETDKIIYRETMVMGTRLARSVNRINNLRNDIAKKHENGRFCGRDYGCVSKFMLKEYRLIELKVEKKLLLNAIETYFNRISPEITGPFQKQLKELFTSENGKCDYAAMTDSLWDGSIFSSLERLEAFVSEEHTIEEYMSDPLYRLFNDVKMVDFNNRISSLEGSPSVIDLERDYTHAMYQMRKDAGIEQYPDANSTMRITYGTVSTVEPRDGIICSWQTTSKGIIEKYNPSSYDFNINPKQLNLLQKEDWSRWGEGSTMPVNFLTDNDITGGNSGSPVLDSKGRLIGLAFDGNKESLASDACFTPDYNRCVCVDIRYILWVLDKYASMDRILTELGY
ncbi:MAG: S46 family peptidase [Candidatus Cryptobacteroides sp.]